MYVNVWKNKILYFWPKFHQKTQIVFFSSDSKNVFRAKKEIFKQGGSRFWQDHF